MSQHTKARSDHPTHSSQAPVLSRQQKRSAKRRLSRRGVASVLSMMFLILFGSLAVAMAIASKGNVQTASTHVHVIRATGAAETGLAIARARLREAASRFIIANSDMSAANCRSYWAGDLSGAGDSVVLAPPSNFPEASLPDGIAQAITNHHLADQNVVSGVTVDEAVIGSAPSGTDLTVFHNANWVFTPAIGIEAAAAGQTRPSVGYSIVYAPLADGQRVRVIVTGYDFSYVRNGQPLNRVIQQDFRLNKRVRQAIVSPSKIMIGKNVMVHGDLGAGFSLVDNTAGQPLILRSDFLGLDTTLDTRINTLFSAIRTSDADGDNRLRVGHPVEGAAIPVDNANPGAFSDATRDGLLDDFDLFINFYDTNGDGRVALSQNLTEGILYPVGGAPTYTQEFVNAAGNPVDDDLGLLVDTAYPDRNKNGISGYEDTNNNGRWDPDEEYNDVGIRGERQVNLDQLLGYRDGYIDRRDQYAKVAGRLIFRVSRSSWQNAQGSPSDALRGPIRPAKNTAAQTYSADTNTLPTMTSDMFSGAETELRDAADGGSFASQVTENLARGGSRTLPGADANGDGMPDSFSAEQVEKMPFNSPSYTDVYIRPIYRDMNFKDVVIPVGTNALFVNCTFAGVTRVETTTGNGHVLWSEYGKMTLDASGNPVLAVPRTRIYGDTADETDFPTGMPNSALPPTQMLRMVATNVNPMDRGDMTAAEYTAARDTSGQPLQLPDPLIVGGRRVIDTKPLSNNIRFHDCTFVGSIVSDNPGTFTQARNKLQFTGKTRFFDKHPEYPDDPRYNPDDEDKEAIAKSSMMLPNYSVDVGTFNSPQEQNVQLKGAVVAGVLDVRGNAEINGALLLTFNPTPGQGPMRDAKGNAFGNPAGFNATIGYFGPEDGDQEAKDPRTLPLVNGQRVVGWDLNSDGIPDIIPPATPTAAQAAAVPVPFNGYGHVHLRFDPNMALPSGIMLPLEFQTLNETYKEGKH